MKPFEEKQQIMDDLNNMITDYSQFSTFKSFVNEYFTDNDYQNFMLSKQNLKQANDPINNEYFRLVKDFKTSFEKLDGHSKLMKDYQKLKTD